MEGRIGFQFKYSPLHLEKKGRNYLLFPSVFSSQEDAYHPWSFPSPNWNDLSWILFHSVFSASFLWQFCILAQKHAGNPCLKTKIPPFQRNHFAGPAMLFSQCCEPQTLPFINMAAKLNRNWQSGEGISCHVLKQDTNIMELSTSKTWGWWGERREPGEHS